MSDSEQPLILVVDDYQDAREMYAEYLQFSGFRVAEARNGNEAVAQAFQLKPDLILMDLSLPGMDGWEATRRLKADYTAVASVEAGYLRDGALNAAEVADLDTRLDALDARLGDDSAYAALTPRQRLRRYLDIISGRLEGDRWSRGCLIGDFSLEVPGHSEVLRARLAALSGPVPRPARPEDAQLASVEALPSPEPSATQISSW